MSRLEWNDSLRMDVEPIDSQHKELIRIANGLINAVSLGRDTRTLENVIRRLREYTVFHFHEEEALMERLRYDKRGEHALEHLRLKENVKNCQRLIYRKEELTPEAVLDFMKHWLLHHILESDLQFARFVHRRRQQGLQDAAPGSAAASGGS